MLGEMGLDLCGYYTSLQPYDDLFFCCNFNVVFIKRLVSVIIKQQPRTIHCFNLVTTFLCA